MKLRTNIKYFGILILKLTILLGLIFASPRLGISFQPHLLSETISNFFLPFHLERFILHDGLHYLSIAKNGYYTYEQAFFPLWPLMLSLFVSLEKYLALTSLAVSNIFFILFLWQLLIFLQYFNQTNKFLNWSKIFLILLALPASFIFHTAYTESVYLFLCFLGLNLYMQKKQSYIFLLIVSALLSASRVTGIFLAVSFLILIKEKELRKKLVAIIVGGILGIGSYMIYLHITTQDFLFFLHSQSYFGANRSDHLILFPQVIWRYLKIFATAKIDRVYFVALSEFVATIIGFWGMYLFYKKLIIFQKSEQKHLLNVLLVFSILSLLLPINSGTLSSVPRYILSSPASWIGLSMIQSKLKFQLLLIFLFLWQCILFIFFANGYFVF